MLQQIAGGRLRGQLAAFMMSLGHGATHWIIATIYVLIPFLAKDLGLSYAQAGALISIFHAAAFVANAGSGAIVDISGKYVRIACLSLVIGAFAMISVSFGHGMAWLVLPIIVIGLTNNLWHPAAISYLSRTYPESRGFALSLHTLGATMGDILGPLAAGFLLVSLSWQSTAMVNALPVFAVALIILLSLGKDETASGANHRRQSGGPSYLQGLKMLATDRSVVMLCVMAGFRSMTQNGLLVFLPLYLVNELNAGSILVGFAMTAIQAGAIVSGPVAGAWSDRIGRQPVVSIGMILTSICIFAMSLMPGAYAFIAMSTILGFVMFAIRPVIHSWTLDLAPSHMSGSAISLLFGTQSAMTMAVPIVGGLIADQWGLNAVFYILTVTVSIAAAMSFLIPEAEPTT
jgi:MFS family permease